MGIVRWLQRRSKIEKTSYVVFLAIFLVAILWVVVFAYGTIDINPNRYQILNNASPEIKADWVYAFGARIEKAKVVFDGKDISDSVKLSKRGFSYKSVKDLNEGEHIVTAELYYGALFPKKVKMKWRFTTDTVPPEIEFEDSGSTMLATSQPNMTLKGTSEPFSELEFVLNGKSIFGSQVDESGKFSVKLENLGRKNSLTVIARDRAKNTTTLKLPVVLDRGLPSIISFSPGPDSTVNGTELKFSCRLSEKESEIREVSMSLDGKNIPLEFDRKENTVRKEMQIFKDGEHIAILTVTDAAGNTSKKDWKFTVDTTRIVVDRSERNLYVYKQGRVVRVFRVAVGQPSYPTPAGHWKIIRKSAAPSWHNPGSSWAASMPRYIPPGPSNPLGLRALYLNADGIRIHGTSNVGSIGSPASHGCIRVANYDIVKLFPLVEVGTPVDIIE